MHADPGDILHLAEPLTGVADVADVSVVGFLGGLGDRLANLARCDGWPAVLAAVAVRRPDYVLLGGPVATVDLGALRGAMRTATLGVVILDPAGGTVAPFAPLEAETVDPAGGPDGFTLALRALMRRCRPVALSGRCHAGGVTLDEAALTLSAEGAVAALSLEDFRLLGPLFDRPGRVWPREELLRLAYGAATANAVRTIDVKLNRTRRRLRAALGRDPVRSVRGEGYILDSD